MKTGLLTHIDQVCTNIRIAHMVGAGHCASNVGVDHCASIQSRSIHAIFAKVRAFARTAVRPANAPRAGV